MKEKYDISAFVGKSTKQSVQADLVNRFIKRRKEQKITQKELAVKSGVSYASVRRFEEIGEISFSSLLSLAQAINCLDDFNSLFSFSNVKILNDGECCNV